VTDDELTDAFEAASLGRSITHLEHIRISFVLLRRHDREEGERRLVEGTQRMATALGAADRFDEELTRAWVAAISDALESGDRSAEALLKRHPELEQGDLLGLPAWRRASAAP
jgi:hypothetical protein